MKKTLAIVGALACLTLAGFAPGQAAFVFNPGTGHYYDVTDTNIGWEEAEAEAILKGGHLVAIQDAAEESWLVGTFGSERFWIGFTDKASEGTWLWSSGDPVTYVNWASGEPNNATPPEWGEDYAVMNWSGPAWNDWDKERYDYYPIHGIIEVSAVPLPASILLFGSALLGLLPWRRKP